MVSLLLLVDHVSAFYFSEKHVLQYGKLVIVNRRKPARKGHEDIFQCPTQGKERLGTAHTMLQRIPAGREEKRPYHSPSCEGRPLNNPNYPETQQYFSI